MIQKSFFFIFFALFLSISAAWSQGQRHPAVFQAYNDGKLGLSVALREGSPELMVPYWYTNRFVVAPTFFLQLVQEELDFTLGVATRHYTHIGKPALYFGFRVGSMVLLPFGDEESDNDLKTDLFAGATFGSEYFFTDKMSLGIELRGDFIQSDNRSTRFDNPGGITLMFAPVLLATIYF